MISIQRVERALKDCDSADVETRALAVEATIDTAAALAQHAVSNLQVPGAARPFVAERLARLGSLAVPPLKDLLQQSTDVEVRILAAAVLAQLGSEEGLPVLLNAVREGKVEVCLAATWLARSGAAEAEGAIVERLTRCSLDEENLIVCLITALETLGRPIPDAVRKRFDSSGISAPVRAVLARHDAAIPGEARP